MAQETWGILGSIHNVFFKALGHTKTMGHGSNIMFFSSLWIKKNVWGVPF